MGSPSVGGSSLDRFIIIHVGSIFSGLFWVCCSPCQGIMCWPWHDVLAVHSVVCILCLCVDCDRCRGPAERHGAGQHPNGAASFVEEVMAVQSFCCCPGLVCCPQVFVSAVCHIHNAFAAKGVLLSCVSAVQRSISAIICGCGVCE